MEKWKEQSKTAVGIGSYPPVLGNTVASGLFYSKRPIFRLNHLTVIAVVPKTWKKPKNI